MFDSLSNVFVTSGFMPHGYCFLWTPYLLWSLVGADTLIGLSYYSIPVALWHFVRRRHDLPFKWMFVLFGIFVFACGTTHFVAVWNIWQPVYWLDAGVKAATALVSVVTALLLWPLIPLALRVPGRGELTASNEALRSEIAERTRAEEKLHQMNQELDQRILELKQSEEKFRGLLESAPDAMVIVDQDGRIVIVNTQTENLFGYARTELLGEPIEKLISQRYQDNYVGHRNHYFADPRSRPMGEGLELWGLRKDGREFQVEISLSPLETEEGKLVSSTIRDVTKRERVARELREHQNLLDHAQGLAHLGYWSWDVALNEVIWSDELYRIYGIEARDHDASLEGYLECVHPEDRAATRQAIESALKEGSHFRTEERIVRADGEVRHLVSYGETMNNASGHPIKMIGTCLDVTDQKRNEMALREAAVQLRMLSRRLVDAQEIERRRLAAELHDRVGQNLTALGMNLAIVARSIHGVEEDVMRRLQDSEKLIESTTACVEGVLDELRPPVLEDWALDSVLRWYAEVFSRRTEIAVKTNWQGTLRRLGPARETTLFRITQEALNNVAKHAHARNVKIVLEWREDSVSLEIADDGVGFDAATRDLSKGLGMITMRERAQAIGGHMDIDAAPGAGTRIRVTAPY